MSERVYQKSGIADNRMRDVGVSRQRGTVSDSGVMRTSPLNDGYRREVPSRNAIPKRRSRVRTFAAALVFCVGLVVCFYPHIAQMINNESATRLVAAFNEAVGEPGFFGDGEAAGSGFAYGEIDEDMYGSIFIPKLSLELPVYVGATEANLSKGIAHLEGTSLPTGGESTHCVLAGHNGAVTNEWFTHIDRLGSGDLFYIRNGGSVLTYSVVSTKIIAPTDTSTLLIERGKDLVTLLTCTDSGAERLIVTGERVIE